MTDKSEAAKFGREFGAEVVKRVKDYVEQQLVPIEKRLNAIERELDRNTMKFAGIFNRANEYRRGAVVLHNGCQWYAIKDTVGELPSAGDGPWIMLTTKPGPSKASLKAAPAALRVIGSASGTNVSGKLG